MKYFYKYETIIGPLFILENNGSIVGISNRNMGWEGMFKETPLIKETNRQLNEYFSGKRRFFDLPLYTQGTDFQEKVWKALKQIPYGETRTYKEIAIAIGQPNAMRAVGMANHRNPLMIVIPCHRVIGANGQLVGYGGGLDVKEKLLTLEKTRCLTP